MDFAELARWEPAQPLETSAIVRREVDLGVQREAPTSIGVAASLARHEERADALAAAAHPLDSLAALWTQRHATLDGSRAQVGEERLVELGSRCLIVLIARESAEASEIAQDAAVKASVDQDESWSVSRAASRKLGGASGSREPSPEAFATRVENADRAWTVFP